VIQTIFVVEIAIRLLAHWPHLGRFLRDGWNVFDLAVVAASLLPQAGAFAMVARLARLMRVTRLISVLNNLESAKVELQAGEDRRSPHHAVLESIEVVKARLEELERHLRTGPMAER
jgi:hypothetical protein